MFPVFYSHFFRNVSLSSEVCCCHYTLRPLLPFFHQHFWPRRVKPGRSPSAPSSHVKLHRIDRDGSQQATSSPKIDTRVCAGNLREKRF